MVASPPDSALCFKNTISQLDNFGYRGPLFLMRVSINYELRALPTFAINRFANINVCVYYNTVWGQQSQLLDS